MLNHFYFNTYVLYIHQPEIERLYNKEETHTKNDMSLQKAYKIKCLTRFYYIITIFFIILTLMKYTNKTRSVFPHHDDSKTDLNVTNSYSVAILLCCPNQTNPFLHISQQNLSMLIYEPLDYLITQW